MAVLKGCWSQENYIKAYQYAAEAHNGQLFPGTSLPYIMHINFVSMEIIACLDVEKDHDRNLAVQCALLHDVIEDTETKHDDLVWEFGEKVAQGVMALTKDKSIEKENRMQDSLLRIKKQPHEIWMVKLADRITNLAPPPYSWDGEKISRYKDESIEIYDVLHGASDFLGQRLLKKIEEYSVHISEKFFLSEGVAFAYNAQACKIFRLESYRRVDISDNPDALAIPIRARTISREKAAEVAANFD